MSETKTTYSVNKMEIAKQTVLNGKENRLTYLKREIKNRTESLVDEVKKGNLSWIASEAAKIEELANEAKFIERDLDEMRKVFEFIESNN